MMVQLMQAPDFGNNVLHSLFSECTVPTNGLKISNANENYADKGFVETDFSPKKDVIRGWFLKTIFMKKIRELYQRLK